MPPHRSPPPETSSGGGPKGALRTPENPVSGHFACHLPLSAVGAVRSEDFDEQPSDSHGSSGGDKAVHSRDPQKGNSQKDNIGVIKADNPGSRK